MYLLLSGYHPSSITTEECHLIGERTPLCLLKSLKILRSTMYCPGTFGSSSVSCGRRFLNHNAWEKKRWLELCDGRRNECPSDFRSFPLLSRKPSGFLPWIDGWIQVIGS